MYLYAVSCLRFRMPARRIRRRQLTLGLPRPGPLLRHLSPQRSYGAIRLLRMLLLLLLLLSLSLLLLVVACMVSFLVLCIFFAFVAQVVMVMVVPLLEDVDGGEGGRGGGGGNVDVVATTKVVSTRRDMVLTENAERKQPYNETDRAGSKGSSYLYFVHMYLKGQGFLSFEGGAEAGKALLRPVQEGRLFQNLFAERLLLLSRSPHLRRRCMHICVSYRRREVHLSSTRCRCLKKKKCVLHVTKHLTTRVCVHCPSA